MIENYIIEGIDRLGKSTLIGGLKNKLGFFQVAHYQKPELLQTYLEQSSEITVAEAKKIALQSYQHHSFTHMFEMLDLGRFIMDRSHLGEAVYAKRYRGYSGEYVFDLEKNYDAAGNEFAYNTALILLTTSDFSFIADDGLSLDFSKKEEEQEDFKRAFDRSIIKSKMMIDVSRDGAFKPAEEILNTVYEAFNP